MHDTVPARDGDDDPSAVGYVLVVTLALAGLAWWVSDLTAPSVRGARFDLHLVNTLSWFAFLLFATIAFMAMIGGVCRLVELARRVRNGPSRA